MFDIIGKRFWFFLISGVVILIGVISLATFGLPSGIEFSSGSMLTVEFEESVEYADFKQEINNLGYTDAIIQRTGTGDFLIRTHELSDEDKTQMESALTARFGTLQEAQFNSVSPQIAAETAHNAAIAVAVAAVGILLYVTWAFRRMPKPLHYGACAIVALVHDALIAMGVFSILGAILQWEINLMFITGLLAVIGYSVNNSVVIFDRIRENLTKGSGNPEPFRKYQPDHINRGIGSFPLCRGINPELRRRSHYRCRCRNLQLRFYCTVTTGGVG